MIKSGIFNSVNGDRVYNADDLGEYFSGLLSDGVFKGFENEMEPHTPGGVPVVFIKSGKASLLGKYIKTDAMNVTIEYGGSLPRIDAIVVGVDLDQRTGSIYVKKGEESTTPQIPTLANSETKREICLATVERPAGSTLVAANQLTDRRGDEALCPWVKLTSGVTLGIYKNEVTAQQGDGIVSIGIAAFDSSADILEVYNNGMLLESYHYEIVGTGSGAYISLNDLLESPLASMFTFIVYKTSI